MIDINKCEKCEWAHKQEQIIFCPFIRCMKELEEKRQELRLQITNQAGK